MTAQQPDTILKIKGFRTHFKTDGGVVKAVDSIDFEVLTGQTLGIVGESGSGKTVTGLSIMGLVEQMNISTLDGTMLYKKPDGQTVDLLKLSESQIRHVRGNEIAMIFQEPMSSLNPLMRCGDQIAEMILLHKGGDKKRIKRRCMGGLRRSSFLFRNVSMMLTHISYPVVKNKGS